MLFCKSFFEGESNCKFTIVNRFDITIITHVDNDEGYKSITNQSEDKYHHNRKII